MLVLQAVLQLPVQLPVWAVAVERQLQVVEVLLLLKALQARVAVARSQLHTTTACMPSRPRSARPLAVAVGVD